MTDQEPRENRSQAGSFAVRATQVVDLTALSYVVMVGLLHVSAHDWTIDVTLIWYGLLLGRVLGES